MSEGHEASSRAVGTGFRPESTDIVGPSARRKRTGPGAIGVALALVLGLATGAFPSDDRLVWLLERPDGTTAGNGDDRPFNPASLVKVATTLWALERLGAEHRFETGFGLTGALDPATGKVEGDLVVDGGDDPDFHPENVWLVAMALNRQGLREVSGRIRVDDGLTVGWEGGSSRSARGAEDRAREMAERLRRALDPSLWDRTTREAWGAFAARRGLDEQNPPGIVARDGSGVHSGEHPPPLAVHRSNRLPAMLERFNAWSNNDIERFGEVLGTPEQLARFVTERVGGMVRFETLSGLGTNRMTPRQVVALLRSLAATCARLGLDVREVLPVAGCDPGTFELFPRLQDRFAGSVAGKTGTLVRTDGGVAALAGFVELEAGRATFCVASPGAGHRLRGARRDIENWLIEHAKDAPGSGPCGDAVAWSDDDAGVELRSR